MRRQMIKMATLALALAAASQPAPLAAGGADKATEILAAARKAIGGNKLETMKTFSAEGKTERNVGNFQMNADVELLLSLPDKYVRSESSSGGPMSFSFITGFNGDRLLAQSAPMPGGGGMMVVRMGPGAPPPGEKPTPEQQAEMDRTALRAAKQDLSRLMLGWFGAAHPSVNATYSYAGEAESPDGKADVVDVKGADGFAARLFIDRQTRLPLMVTYQGARRMVVTSGLSMSPATGASREDVQKRIEQARTQPPEMVEYRLYFADWTDMDGIRFPAKLQRASEGTTQEEWTVTKVKVNPKIDAKKFESQG